MHMHLWKSPGTTSSALSLFPGQPFDPVKQGTPKWDFKHIDFILFNTTRQCPWIAYVCISLSAVGQLSMSLTNAQIFDAEEFAMQSLQPWVWSSAYQVLCIFVLNSILSPLMPALWYIAIVCARSKSLYWCTRGSGLNLYKFLVFNHSIMVMRSCVCPHTAATRFPPHWLWLTHARSVGRANCTCGECVQRS